jgi:DNA-binding response OmpR family regulator
MRSPRILIVDDEAPLTALLVHTFENEGYQVSTARDGIDCMNKVASFRPDLIIMDIMMPKLDGVDTTRLIRRNRSYTDTLIVALSAKSDPITRQRMEEAGANCFMRKPFAIAKLVVRVQELLQARTRRD